jgi:hypothetical protein
MIFLSSSFSPGYPAGFTGQIRFSLSWFALNFPGIENCRLTSKDDNDLMKAAVNYEFSWEEANPESDVSIPLEEKK